MQLADNVKSELHKHTTVHKEKKKRYADIGRRCSSRNNEGLSFFEEFVSTKDVSKN